MPEYRLTFGVQYAREPHPTFPAAHPDGWVTVVAPDYDAARALVVERIGSAWSDLISPGSEYPWELFPRELFPRREIDRWKAETKPTLTILVVRGDGRG